MAMPVMAYWISPTGEIQEIPYGSRHMDDVRKNPEKYGYTSKDIETGDTGDERYRGEEGENLRIALVKNGWVRIRKYLRAPWVIETWNVDRARRRIEDWANHLIQTHAAAEDEPAMVVEVPRDRQVQTVIGDLANGILSESILKTLWKPLLEE